MHLIALCLFSQLLLSVLGLKNVTIDDSNPSIQYVGEWGRSVQTSLDYNGTHMLTTNTAAVAFFNFTGAAIYFWSPLWPYAVSTAITLDSRPTVIVDLTDYNSPPTEGGIETGQSRVVWSAENLSNTKHTLRISVGRGQQFAIVDGITYTTLAPGESLSSSDGNHVIVIILATLVAVLAILVLALLCWLCLRRRRTSTSRARRTSTASSAKMGDDASVVGRDPLGSPRSPPTSPRSPPTAPRMIPPPSRPDSNYQPGEPAWSTSSVGGPGVQNMTGIGVSTRNSHATSYNHGHSEGELGDHDPSTYTNRNPHYPNI